MVAEVVNGRYEILGPLGAGRQGRVFRVRDADGGIGVLKALATGATAAEERALLAEFGHLAGVEHRALPRVREVAVAQDGPLDAGTVFFTAELVPGRPLLDAVAATPEAERARLLWSVARDLADALAALHGAGLLHHDVTPA